MTGVHADISMADNQLQVSFTQSCLSSHALRYLNEV